MREFDDNWKVVNDGNSCEGGTIEKEGMRASRVVFRRDRINQVRPTSGNLVVSSAKDARCLIDGANISSRNYPKRLGSTLSHPVLLYRSTFCVYVHFFAS